MKKAIGILALAGVLGIGTALVLTRSGTPAHVPLVSITTPAPADGTVPIETAAAGTATAAQAAPAAAVPPVPAPKLDTGNTAWMLVSTALVLLMTIPGLALFYGGMVRKKNVLSTLMQSFAICSVVTVLWFMFGYSLAFTPGNGFIGGLDKMFLNGVAIDSLTGTAGANIPETVFVVFQMTFAIITPALIAGAFAERMKFSAMLVFMVLWMFAVYVPVAHWVWEPTGWMFKDGVLDFAGGTVVHINAGVAGLVCALVLGKRVGFGKEAMPPHNLVLTMVGASMLWVGWFGFNAGSALEASGRAGMAMLVTQIAAGTAAVSWMLAEWVMKKKASVLGIVSGAVAGLVAITAGCDTVSPFGAFFIGFVAGLLVVLSVEFFDNIAKVDDPVGAVSVHFANGVWGTIAVGLFSTGANTEHAGLFYGGGLAQLGTQLLGLVTVDIYVVVVMFIIFKLIDKFIGLRVPAEVEIDGLDIHEHGLASAYAGFAISDANSAAMVPNENTDLGEDDASKASAKQMDAAVPVVREPAVIHDGIYDTGMHKVSIIAKLSKFDQLKTALNDLGVTGMTVTQVMGCGIQKGTTEKYRGVPVDSTLLPKIKVEVIVSKISVDAVVDAAKKALYTGHIGDGKIFVYNVTRVVKIRTGEEDFAALQDVE